MKRILRVLNIEDSARDAALLQRHLSQAGYEVTSERVETPATMRAALASQAWDVILCDYSMPHFSAMQALALLKEMRLDIPFIIISGTIGEELAVEAMLAGAHDYLMKDKLARLAPAIERELHEAENRLARRQAEASLRRSQEQLAGVIGSAMDAIITVDSEQRVLVFNRAAEKMFRCSTGEALGQHLGRFIPERFRSSHAEHIETFGQVNVTQRSMGNLVAVFGLRADGEEFPIEASISQVEVNDGKIFTVVLRDITKRKQTEEKNAQLLAQLQDQKQRIDTLIASVPGVVWEAWGQPNAASQRVDFVSDYVIEMLGYKVEEWLSTPNFWLSIVHPDDQEQAAKEAAAIYASGKGSLHLMRWMTKDGRALWIESHIVVVCDEADRPIGMRGVSLDISERKRAEEEVIKARNLALEAARIKSEFLANMNHELRTPMNGIIGLTEVVLDTDLTLEQREFLELVKNSADSLMILINNLMTFSEYDSIKLKTIEFSLEGSLHECLSLFASPAREKGLTLVYEVSPEAPGILIGDPSRLNKALMILIDNAIKFTERGEVAVCISQESCTENEVCLRFTVRDTGVGIPADKQEMIFIPFTQADGSATRRYGGSGLGLAVCQRIVEMLGGRIWVESEPGVGSAFHFTAQFAVTGH